jgi:hypothetical protein
MKMVLLAGVNVYSTEDNNYEYEVKTESWHRGLAVHAYKYWPRLTAKHNHCILRVKL